MLSGMLSSHRILHGHSTGEAEMHLTGAGPKLHAVCVRSSAGLEEESLQELGRDQWCPKRGS